MLPMKLLNKKFELLEFENKATKPVTASRPQGGSTVDVPGGFQNYGLSAFVRPCPTFDFIKK
jgi:hypothetical protein